MEWLLYFALFCLGAVIGSFLNVVIDRLPRGQSIAYPPSRCGDCGQSLKPLDLVPVYSYLRLKGRCRYCGSPIPRRILLVEILGALLFVLVYWQLGLNWLLLPALLFTCLFVALSFIDIEHGILPDIMVLPAMPLALGTFVLLGDKIQGFSQYMLHDVSPYLDRLVFSLIGGAGAFVIMLLVALISSRLLKKEAMGGGDIKLAGLMGLLLGYPLVVFSLYIAILLGALGAGLFLLLRSRGWKDPIPFGPFLCLGALATLLYGGMMLRAYLGMG